MYAAVRPRCSDEPAGSEKPLHAARCGRGDAGDRLDRAVRGRRAAAPEPLGGDAVRGAPVERSACARPAVVCRRRLSPLCAHADRGLVVGILPPCRGEARLRSRGVYRHRRILSIGDRGRRHRVAALAPARCPHCSPRLGALGDTPRGATDWIARRQRRCVCRGVAPSAIGTRALPAARRSGTYSGYRADADGSSVRFNPLEEVRVGTDLEVKDVQNIATMIVDPDGRGLNDHWAKTGHALLVGTILHVLYAEHNKTLHGVASFLSDPTRNIEQTIEALLQTAHAAEGTRHWHDSTGRPTRTHPVVDEASRELLNKSENERSCVLSTAMSFLGLYRDPVVARNTAASEFKIGDLMHAERPVSLYLIVAPSDKDRLKPLVRLIVNQVVRSLTERMSFLDGRSVAGYRHRLLLMIDELPALGRLEVFQEALAYIAGYGRKAYLITQDLSQLYAAYGREESNVSNCHVRVAFAPNKIETGELLSKMAGVMTVHRTTRSYSGHRLSPALTQMTAARQETARNLLTPDEAMRLPGLRFENGRAVAGDEIVFVAGHSPIYGQQILYFQDSVFSVRAKIAPPYVSDKVRE